MTKDFDVIEPAGNGQLTGVTMDLSSFSTVLHAIFAEGADYTKKSVESRLAVVEKLLGAKSLETVIQIQSEYAKASYAAFVAQAAKMGELHSNLAKAVFRQHARHEVIGFIRSARWVCAQSASRSNGLI